MKIFLVMLTMLVTILTSGQSLNSDSKEKCWEQAMLVRKNAIEKKFGMKFNNGWIPKMEFKSSDTISHEIIFYDGRYIKETGSFRINKKFRDANIPSIGDTITKLADSISLLIDHELAHALIDHISYRLNGKTWPVGSSFYSRWEVLQVRILTEGTADYFKNMMSGDTTSSIENLPNNLESSLWQTNMWIYNGGYFVVKPIIEKYGQKGIEYLITHPLFLVSYDVQSSCVEYQKNALKELEALR